MIATIHYQKLWIAEFIQFLKDFVSLYRDNNPDGFSNGTDLEPLEESINKLEALFKNKQGSDLTKEMIALNKRRNNAIKLLTSHTKGYSKYYFEDTRRMAAEKIYRKITRYGRFIYRQNFQAETNILSNLVNDLLSDNELAKAVEILALQPLVDELKTANELFNEKFLDRTLEMSQRPAVSASELKNTVMVHYRNLVSLIEARVLVSGSDKYQNLIDHLNELIEGYNELAASHSNKKESRAEKGR
jgi:hypothetical protein